MGKQTDQIHLSLKLVDLDIK